MKTWTMVLFATVLIFGLISYPLLSISHELHELRRELAVVKDVDDNLTNLRQDVSRMKEDIEHVETKAKKSWVFKLLFGADQPK